MVDTVDSKGKKEYEKRLHKVMNGSMVTNMEDAKYLGEQMDYLRTNEELKEFGWIPDPIQHEVETQEERP